MEAEPTDVVLGIGSTHGDDQLGWAVIDKLSRSETRAVLRKIRHPIDILPWLESSAQVHVVDAAIGLPDVASIQRLDFVNPHHRSRIQEISFAGTHDAGLYPALMMASALGMRTDQVVIWLGHASKFQPMSAMSEKTRASVQAMILPLTQSLCDARSVSG